MSAVKVVAVTGNPGNPSRTRALVDAVLIALSERLRIVEHVIAVPELGADLVQSSYRKQVGARAAAALDAIESADLLVVASPVYRGSYTGLFKHLFDLVDLDGLVGTPVLLGATGGSERHALVIDHQLRPLFSFFRALTVPTGVYATEADFDQYRVASANVLDRIAAAADEAASITRGRQAIVPRRPVAAA